MTDRETKNRRTHKEVSAKTLSVYKVLFYVNAIVFTVLNIIAAINFLVYYSYSLGVIIFSIIPSGFAWIGVPFYRHQIKKGYIRNSDLLATFIMSIVMASFAFIVFRFIMEPI